MAPAKSKRVESSKAAPPTKKAKLQASSCEPESEDPLLKQLDPILSALSSSELPEHCCDIFRVALPLCIGVASEERHSYQTKVLDLAASSMQSLEVSRRAAFTEAEARVETLKNEGLAARNNAEVARGVAAAKQEESDAKVPEVAERASEVSAAKLALDDDVVRKEALIASKAAITVEQDDFGKVLETIWEPLKVAAWAGHSWRKREKAVAELTEKLKPVGLDESLVDALAAALKLKPEQRQGFAQRAMDFAQEAFVKHAASLAEQIASKSAEVDSREKAVTGATAKLTEVQALHVEKEKEWEELQKCCAELETIANTAQTAAAAFHAEIQAAEAGALAEKSNLEAAVALSESFVLLRDSPPLVVQQPDGAPEAPQSEHPTTVAETSLAMKLEVEAVAVCA